MRDTGAELMLDQEFLQVLFAQSPDAMILVNLDGTDGAGRIVDCNVAACRLYGYTREQLLGLELTALSAEHATPTAADTLKRMGRAQQRVETFHCRHDGTSMAVELALASLASADRHLLFVTIRDITHHWRTERRLAAQHAISRVLAEADHFMDAAPRMLASIGEHLDWAQGMLWCVDNDAGVLRCTTTWHAPHVSGAFEEASRQMTLAPSVGLPGTVWSTGAPTWYGDLHTAAAFVRSAIAAQAGFHSAFAFPILGEAGVFGVMEFFSHDMRAPDAELLEMARAIGTQSGQYIERRRAQAAVRASEVRKGAVLEAALDAIVTIDHLGTVTEFNPAAEHIFGYGRDEAIGHDMADLIIPEPLREQHRRGLARLLATGVGTIIGRRIEISAQRADGTLFPVELSITRIPADGPPVFTGFARDITARKQSEARQQFLTEASTLLASSLDYQMTLASLTRLAVPTLADWCSINLFNSAGVLERVVGHHVDPAKEAELHQVRVQYPPDPGRPVLSGATLTPDKPVLVPEVTEGHLASLAQHPEQLRVYREMGFRSALLVPLRAGDRPLGMLFLATGESGRSYGQEDLALAEDVANRAALAIENARLYHEAQDAIHLRDEFLSVAAHELKTPVTALVGYAQLLKRRATSSERDRRAFTTLVEQSERLAKLVTTVLDVSRIQLGTFVLDRLPVDLGTVASQVAEEFQTALEALHRGHSLTYSCSERPVVVDGDATRLGQVIRNLVQNAAKYSPDGGRIELLVDQQQDEAVLVVRDQGIGIPPEDQSRLFQRFYRVPTVDLNISGMGMGLYVVHEIVTRHGGTVEVASTEGHGSTFTVRLPLASAPVTSSDVNEGG